MAGRVCGLGGFGAVASATLAVTPGQVLYVDVGGNGEAGGNPDDFPVDMTFGKGGFNGGSDGGGGGSGLFIWRRRRRRRLPRTFVRFRGRLPPSALAWSWPAAAAGQDQEGTAAGRVRLAPPGARASVGCRRAGWAAPPAPRLPVAVGAQAGGPLSLLIGAAGSDGALGDGGAGGRSQFGGGGGGGGGLHGGGGGGSGVGDVTSQTLCTAGGGGGGSAFFASATTNTALAIDTSGVPRVTLTYSPPGGGSGPLPGGGSVGARPLFGARTLVTLKLAASRIPAKRTDRDPGGECEQLRDHRQTVGRDRQ